RSSGYLAAAPESSSLPLHDALPIYGAVHAVVIGRDAADGRKGCLATGPEGEALGVAGRYLDRDRPGGAGDVADPFEKMVDLGGGSEEHTSELQSRENLVCRLLLETK